MELRHLRYLTAVAEAGGFRRAAAQIHVAQQALSTQIADLETELGVRLFERSAQGVRLSSAGRECLARAEVILRQVAELATAMRAAAASAGAIRVSRSYPMYFSNIFGKGFHLFRECCRDADLSVTERPTGGQLDALHAGRIDVSLGAGVPAQREIGHRAEVLSTHALSGVLLSRRHSLSANRELTLADLQDQRLTLALEGSEPGLLRWVLGGVERLGLSRTRLDFTGTLSLLLERVEFDQVLTLAPSDAALGAPRGLVFRPVRGLHLPYLLVARWRRADRNPLVGLLLDSLRFAVSTRAREGPRTLARPGAALRLSSELPAAPSASI